MFSLYANKQKNPEIEEHYNGFLYQPSSAEKDKTIKRFQRFWKLSTKATEFIVRVKKIV